VGRSLSCLKERAVIREDAPANVSIRLIDTADQIVDREVVET
jgi:hypothetical protein